MNRLTLILSMVVCTACFSQPASAAPDALHRAFKAVFGSDEAATLPLKDNYVRFTPDQLVKLPAGYAMVSVGRPVEGPYSDTPDFDWHAAHSASPKVAIHYFTADFQVTKAFVPATSIGMNGDGGPYVHSGEAMDGYPTIYVEGNEMGGGFRCTEMTVLELRPAGPIEVASLIAGVEFSGAGLPDHLTSHVTHVIPGKSFDVAYTGNRRFTDHYTKSGDRYLLKGKSGVPHC